MLSHLHDMIDSGCLRSLNLFKPLDTFLFLFYHSKEFVQVHISKYFKFSSFGFQLFKLIAFSTSHLSHFLFVSSFKLDLIFETLNHLFLGSKFVLKTVQFLLEDFLPFLRFCQLLPQSRVGSQLLVQIIYFKVMSLLCENFFHFLEKALLAHLLHYNINFFSGLRFTFS